MSLLSSLNKAVRAARKGGTLSDLDEPTLELARTLARELDVKDKYMRELARDAHERGAAPPTDDRTTPQTYARVLKDLGFSPSARLQPAKGGSRANSNRKPNSALGQLRAVSSE